MPVLEFGQQNPNVIMLLHGGGLSWWNYREAAKILSAQYHVVLPVLDGHADSDAPFTAIKPSLSETNAKVKIVAGSREQRNIRNSAKLLQTAIPGSTMELLPGLHHGDLSLNKPEQYAKILTDWIGETL